MFRVVLTALVAVFLCLPTVAGEPCEKFDDIIGKLAAEGTTTLVIPDAQLPGLLDRVNAMTGERHDGATRAFIMGRPAGALVGIEVDGCLLPPIPIPGTADHPVQLSGKSPDGRIGA